MSQRLSFQECRKVFELLGYYPDFDDPNLYVSATGILGPKAFAAFAEALDEVDPESLIQWMSSYHGMSANAVREAIAAVIAERR